MENNFVLTGNEARLLIQSLTSESMTYNGPALPFVTNLLIRLENISLNQPPKQIEAAQSGERNVGSND